MSYARNLLSRGEEVVHESRQHWFAVIARTWVWIIVAFASLWLLIFVTSQKNPVGSPQVDLALTALGAVALLVALVRIAWVIWGWRSQEYLVTTRRVIKAEGILNKNMADSGLEKINDAKLSQSWVGRIFNYGTLDILTAAEEYSGGPIDDFPMLADPVDFKKAMLNQKELLERPDLAPPRYQRQQAPPELRRADPMPPRAGSDRVAQVQSGEPQVASAVADEPAPSPPRPSAADEVAATLERLAGLRDKGFITPDEYEAKKRELLERM
ncbi:MAG: PH domain-containing protein [Chloroflexota bacterium]|nr:PH domain-containing protein [Chloroflexota bacterium]